MPNVLDRTVSTSVGDAHDTLLTAASHAAGAGIEDELFEEADGMLAGAPVRDMLSALALAREEWLYDDLGEEHYDTAVSLVTEVLLRLSDDVCLEEFAAFAAACANPAQVAALAYHTLILNGKKWSPETFESPHPGRVTRKLYDAIFLSTDPPRTGYLRRQLALTASTLEPNVRQLAYALAEEWAGTFDALVEVTRDLAITRPRD